jgi:hypothetical protein
MVFLHVEVTKEHGCFLKENTRKRLICQLFALPIISHCKKLGNRNALGGWVGWLHLVDAKNRPTPAESFIGTPEEHISDPELTKSTSTHNAWLDSDVQIGALEDFSIVRLVRSDEEICHCERFTDVQAMSGRVVAVFIARYHLLATH